MVRGLAGYGPEVTVHYLHADPQPEVEICDRPLRSMASPALHVLCHAVCQHYKAAAPDIVVSKHVTQLESVVSPVFKRAMAGIGYGDGGICTAGSTYRQYV